MENKEIGAILSLLHSLSEEELIKVKEFLKDLYSHPYGELFIEIHENQIVNLDYKKKKRYQLKKKRE